MPSPFPGMNPYIEQADVWDDFHLCYMVRLREAVARQLPEAYYAQIDAHVYSAPHPEGGSIKARFIRIREVKSRAVVTVLRLLKPEEKCPGPIRREYLRERSTLLEGPCSLVEMDLLRGPSRPTPPMLPECDYYILVRRADDRDQFLVWALELRQPLPAVRVPLPAPNEDVMIELQPPLHEVHDSGKYELYIYEGVPDVPLSATDKEWANEVLRATG